ncbi:inorganic phosphate transporter [Pseudomonas sp. N040]|uniref:inorganic phosphate transporter n=1 Tax=Pseudomonas sp. N040 TaxID=2785325 RepID=UPI0018A29ED5|nr:inorganic phosphate transporter [Pseudomonas sp. N040]MBF7730079.1 anion permease [Pseudomonas sp. N040]MBW7013721.1 inorganic phosphate transporter [Pseudomonas sp. N040]
MFEFISSLNPALVISLVLALVFVLTFEFINGFHDTANAVATVIYTNAMPSHIAVIASGICNFLGVLLGGVGVAYAIVHLLPVELLINANATYGLVMVFSLLSAAIIWNLGTWYLGIPASSSHTLIGSILGVGLGNALISDIAVADGVNWQKAIDIAISLVASPLAGFLVAGLVLLGLKWLRQHSKMHFKPDQRLQADGKKHPPFWSRVTLIASSMGLSFVHGSNDGQKGIGLLMLVLIGIVPAQFVLDLDSSTYQIERTRDAAEHLLQFYQRHDDSLGEYLSLGKNGNTEMPKQFRCDPAMTGPTIAALLNDLKGVTDYKQMAPEVRPQVRRYLLCLDDTAKKVGKLSSLDSKEKADLDKLRKDLAATTEYAPTWVIFAVALALGIGTMVGWKRVVLTVGEKIGRQGMTYAQGMSAQITATAAIGLATAYGLPVSTTHVLSSGVAGTMVANKSGLQFDTVRNILIAWVLTLPVTIGLAAGLFWISVQLFV